MSYRILNSIFQTCLESFSNYRFRYEMFLSSYDEFHLTIEADQKLTHFPTYTDTTINTKTIKFIFPNPKKYNAKLSSFSSISICSFSGIHTSSFLLLVNSVKLLFFYNLTIIFKILYNWCIRISIV